MQWPRIGELQLHISVRQVDAPTYNHFALAVDDFESVFRTTRERRGHDAGVMGYTLGELPSGQVQLFYCVLATDYPVTAIGASCGSRFSSCPGLAVKLFAFRTWTGGVPTI